MVLSGQRRHFCPPYTSLLFASRPFSFIYFLFPFIYFFSPSVLLGSFFLPFLAFPVSLSATRRTRKIVTIHFRHQSELTSLSELQRLCPQFNGE